MPPVRSVFISKRFSDDLEVAQAQGDGGAPGEEGKDGGDGGGYLA